MIYTLLILQNVSHFTDRCCAIKKFITLSLIEIGKENVKIVDSTTETSKKCLSDLCIQTNFKIKI